MIDKANCKRCSKLVNGNDSFVFMSEIYHTTCFRCKCCSKKLYNSQINNIPLELAYLDKYGNLLCLNDYISSLNCKICLQPFNINSNINELKSCFESTVSTSEECLAHVECIYCCYCKYKLNASDEYHFNEYINKLSCKICSLEHQQEQEDDDHFGFDFDNLNKNKRKKLKPISERLSTRQKELIKTKLLTINCDLVELKTNFYETISEFALQIDCNEKCILNYIDKRLAKRILTVKKQIPNDTTTTTTTQLNNNVKANNYLQHKNDDSVSDQLTKLDRTIAPNQNPFKNTDYKEPINNNNFYN